MKYSELEKYKLDRLIFFSDAVFAIVLTLLVLEIHIPEIKAPDSAAELWQTILSMAPRFYCFLLSFAVITINWVAHHHFYGLVRKADSNLIWFNSLMLLIICFLPFPAALIGEYPFNKTALFLFGFMQGIYGTTSTIMTLYVLRKGYFNDWVDEKLLKLIVGKPLFTILLNLLSPFLAFISVYAAYIFFIL